MFTLIIEDKQGGIQNEYTFEEGEFTIGRSQQADIMLPSDNVSRNHARLYTVDSRCYIEDLGSSNGVFVNGRRIHEVYQIQRSAQVKVGDYYLHIEGGSGGSEEVVHCSLIGQNLAFTDQVFKVSRPVTLVGRGKNCSLTLIDPSISRVHSKLTVERGGSLTLEDLKSSNGTFVNGERIESATIEAGDVIRFGNAEMLVEVPKSLAGTGFGGLAEGFSGELDDSWAPPKRRTGLMIFLVILATLAVAAAVVFGVFGDKIFGEAEVPPIETSVPTVDEEALQQAKDDQAELERKDDERKAQIKALFTDGAKLLDDRKWDEALEKFEALKKLDPVNEDAQRSISFISDRKREQERMASAKQLEEKVQHGDAYVLLGKIPDTSPYYTDARKRMEELRKMKPVLTLKGDNKLSEKLCEAALAFYEQARLLDRTDLEVLEKIKSTKATPKRKCKDAEPPEAPK